MIPEYLVSFDTEQLPVEEVDVLIIGIGIAGLRTALSLRELKTLVIAKDGIKESCTYNAQGGIAAAMDFEDSPEKHIEDTLRAGAGLNNELAVEILSREGVKRVAELISWGFRFDTAGERLQFGREAGHSCCRVLHSQGDSTGQAVARFLLKKAQDSGVKIAERIFLVDLLVNEKEISGAILLDMDQSKLTVIRTNCVVLASGGAGQLFQETTNPAAITGDGQAAAYRCGAELSDLEFFQFHPTTLYLAGAPRFLISEALRGEGAFLRNSARERFMNDYHEAAELAPRDVVSRAIIDQMKKTGSICVYLDLTHLPARRIRNRFPTIAEFCKRYGLDITRDLIPVRPAAHYFMGGIKTNIWGETNLQGLYAVGEVACNGVHGANRLASNSLLEGLVFGARVAERIKQQAMPRKPWPRFRYKFPQTADILIDRDDLKRSIKSLMWRHVGIERNRLDLTGSLEKIQNWERYAFLKEFGEASGFESQNMLILAGLIINSALRRQESRGAHFRTDFPRSEKSWKKHIVVSRHDCYLAND
ncbi:MAG: L-aspartate oxidase [Candidatus Omnitrophica bacterium]|nr:L-aspartate oxidase [Candidatus Omnitrophota bacterium]